MADAMTLHEMKFIFPKGPPIHICAAGRSMMEYVMSVCTSRQCKWKPM